ncbi:hypothetical protein BDF20DRAFT_983506 [Mycotypha africana]|uniref:uncharacterized protein n=1 Tax=Mycotypha africana TaxID=64632 RepID=UPI0022FFCB3A|nr:uncharacterized protein BDF20DRAFT_983506 [Mycotypha africana]KAI8966975.1 hypothetical protein BDF20DRAFT_983506 [Mycotypha africana]
MGSNSSVVKSLQPMILGLQERSLVDQVYVTVSCNSKTPLRRRDLKKNKIIDELSEYKFESNTNLLFVDLINNLAKMDKACLVIIDSAGWTTNMNDLELFIRYVAYLFPKQSD